MEKTVEFNEFIGHYKGWFKDDNIEQFFDFWEFADVTAPLSNYIGWFLVAFPIQWVYQTQVKIKDRVFSFHLVLVQFFFFGVFSLIQLAS